MESLGMERSKPSTGSCIHSSFSRSSFVLTDFPAHTNCKALVSNFNPELYLPQAVATQFRVSLGEGYPEHP